MLLPCSTIPIRPFSSTPDDLFSRSRSRSSSPKWVQDINNNGESVENKVLTLKSNRSIEYRYRLQEVNSSKKADAVDHGKQRGEVKKYEAVRGKGDARIAHCNSQSGRRGGLPSKYTKCFHHFLRHVLFLRDCQLSFQGILRTVQYGTVLLLITFYSRTRLEQLRCHTD